MSAFDADPWATDTPAADPWAAEAPAPEPPADEAQATPNTTTPSKESTITSNGTSEGKIVTTVKYGAGFDAPWTVIHSNSVEEAMATLNEAKALLELTAKVARFAKSLDSGTAQAAARPAANGGAPARPQASAPAGQESKSCAHGEMTYRTGNGAKGPWAAHFCPLEKGNPDQCKPLFVKQR
ncbi:hypothetical protein SAMN05216275_10518 [Streptosporangium canum]|uniref:Uncharacterized protein n=1 Tax=Streptosporangium canum TaxID=324952 RepID=A0A1I3L5C3_9ACTN|nr:hypothetical protein [Streptosporangium canum]SFI79891.1 hypothetical protein SAMN05216275_10518 [Streptosporangium canum]